MMIINKKNLLLVVFLSANSFFCVYGMEKIGDRFFENSEKLENLIGDSLFKERKNIIYFMIEHDKIHPDNIFYQRTYPLYEAMIHDDIDFITYLLRNGARPELKHLELIAFNSYEDVQKNDQLRKLFLEYNIIFYNKNKQDDILPCWYPGDPLQNLPTSLKYIADSIKTNKKEINFIINVPHTKKYVLDEIKKIGFTIQLSDNKKTQLVYKIKNVLYTQLSQGSNKTRELIGMS